MKGKNNNIAILVLVLSVIGAGIYWSKTKGSVEKRVVQKPAAATLVAPDEFDRLAGELDAFVLDVHIPQQSHIPGTDAFIPYNELSEHRDELPEDPNTPILVYCRSGSMSREASEELVGMGYSRVYDLAGGTNAYKTVRSIIAMTPVQTDLGTVVYGDVARTEFTLTNYTPELVHITRVSTSCGCTSAEVEKDVLAPHESVVVHVSFDPAVHNDDTDLGDVTRTIFVDTDHAQFAQVVATITAYVVKE